jgi:hypothetical protein
MSHESDGEYLKSKGWRHIQSTPSPHNASQVLSYWDHDEHQKVSGRWYTQGEALSKQRSLDKGDYAL